MELLLRALPILFFVTPLIALEVGFGDWTLRSQIPIVVAATFEAGVILFIAMFRERRMASKTQAETPPPHLQRVAYGPAALCLTPGLAQSVIWARSLRGRGMILVSRALLSGTSDRELIDAIQWANAQIAQPGSAARSFAAAMAEGLERMGALDVDSRSQASVLRLIWGVMLLPLSRGFRLWAGPTTLVLSRVQR